MKDGTGGASVHSSSTVDLVFSVCGVCFAPGERMSVLPRMPGVTPLMPAVFTFTEEEDGVDAAVSGVVDG